MPPIRRLSALARAGALALAGALAAPAGAAPDVVASIVPVHSLVAGVMRGVARPTLLVRGGGSPHAWQLRPSDAAALEAADLVFWVGRELEPFLARPIASLGRRARVVAFAGIDGVRLLAAREGGAWGDGHDHATHEGAIHEGATHEGEGHEGEGHEGAAARPGAPGHGARHDAHLWLDPGNAARFVAAAADALAAADPAHAAAYRRNAEALAARIEALDRSLEARLRPVRDVPYAVFHDAYRYFERRYGTHAIGAITVHPQRPAGARRIVELREAIAATGAACVFREPQFEPELVATLVEGTGARTGVLDPLGAALEPGPDAWFEMMESLADAMVECLGAR